MMVASSLKAHLGKGVNKKCGRPTSLKHKAGRQDVTLFVFSPARHWCSPVQAKNLVSNSRTPGGRMITNLCTYSTKPKLFQPLTRSSCFFCSCLSSSWTVLSWESLSRRLKGQHFTQFHHQSLVRQGFFSFFFPTMLKVLPEL